MWFRAAALGAGEGASCVTSGTCILLPPETPESRGDGRARGGPFWARRPSWSCCGELNSPGARSPGAEAELSGVWSREDSGGTWPSCVCFIPLKKEKPGTATVAELIVNNPRAGPAPQPPTAPPQLPF
ncbi:hypothetical protein H8959_014188 [Pygathrix nigripes]